MSHAPRPHEPPEQPATEWGSAAQTVPHAPQLRGSVANIDSQPSPPAWSQSPKPVAHTRPHAPNVQTAVECGPEAHPLPQPLQLFASVTIEVSQPFALSASQSAKPEAHESPQALAAHTGAALGPPAQTFPQVPQL